MGKYNYQIKFFAIITVAIITGYIIIGGVFAVLTMNDIDLPFETAKTEIEIGDKKITFNVSLTLDRSGYIGEKQDRYIRIEIFILTENIKLKGDEIIVILRYENSEINDLIESFEYKANDKTINITAKTIEKEQLGGDEINIYLVIENKIYSSMSGYFLIKNKNKEKNYVS